MPRPSRFVPLLLVGLSAASLTGCYVRAQPQPITVGATVQAEADYQVVYPTAAPPPPVYEVRPQPPGYGYVWVDGYWDWTGYDWSWSSGYWQPERPGFVFIGPRYVYESGRPVYYRGYWQGSNGYRDYHYVATPQPGWRGTPAAPPPGGWRATPAPPPASNGWRGATPAAPPPASNGWRGTSPAAPPPASAGWHATPGPAPAPAPAPAAGGWRGTAPAPAPSASPPPPSGGGWHAAPTPAAPPPASGGWQAQPARPAPGFGTQPGTMPPPSAASTMPGGHPAPSPAPVSPAPAPAAPGAGGWHAATPQPGTTTSNPGWAQPGHPVHPATPATGAPPPGQVRPNPAPSMGGWHAAPMAPSGGGGGNMAGQMGSSHPGGGAASQVGGARPMGGGAAPAARPNTAVPAFGRPAPAPVQSQPSSPAPQRGNWMKKK